VITAAQGLTHLVYNSCIKAAYPYFFETMNKTTRQTFLFMSFMSMLVATFLFLFVYAPEPIDVYRPSADDIIEGSLNFLEWVGDTIISLFSIIF